MNKMNVDKVKDTEENEDDDVQRIQRGIRFFKGKNSRDCRIWIEQNHFPDDCPAPIMTLEYACFTNACVNMLMSTYCEDFVTSDRDFEESNGVEGKYFYYDSKTMKKVPKFLFYKDEDRKYRVFHDTTEYLLDKDGTKYLRSDGYWRGVSGKIRHYYISEKIESVRGNKEGTRRGEGLKGGSIGEELGDGIHVREGGDGIRARKGGDGNHAREGGDVNHAREGEDASRARERGDGKHAREGGDASRAREGGDVNHVRKGVDASRAREGEDGNRAREIGDRNRTVRGGWGNCTGGGVWANCTGGGGWGKTSGKGWPKASEKGWGKSTRGEQWRNRREERGGIQAVGGGWLNRKEVREKYAYTEKRQRERKKGPYIAFKMIKEKKIFDSDVN